MDLVVMTTHGKSGIKRAIMGSVADAVIRESGKPVLVIRPNTRGKK
jgi:nucleotide-binding universal stress UspA family protein